MEADKVQELLAMFDANINVLGIASELGVSEQTVRRVLKEHGKETKRRSKVVDEENVVQQYMDGVAVPTILSSHNINYAELYKILAKNKVSTRKVVFGEAAKAILDRAVELYVASMPLWAIREETGIAQPTLHAELHKRNVPLRRPRLL